jgi:hypothetical protein
VRCAGELREAPFGAAQPVGLFAPLCGLAVGQISHSHDSASIHKFLMLSRRMRSRGAICCQVAEGTRALFCRQQHSKCHIICNIVELTASGHPLCAMSDPGLASTFWRACPAELLTRHVLCIRYLLAGNSTCLLQEVRGPRLLIVSTMGAWSSFLSFIR